MDLKLKYQTFRAKPSKSLSQTFTRYKTLLNELTNDGVTLSKHEITVGFVNSLPKKRLSFSQGLRNSNHTRPLTLLIFMGVSRSSSVSKGFQPKFTPKLIQSSQHTQSSQSEPKFQKDYKAEYKKIKAKLALLEANPSTSQSPKPFQSKNKGLVAKTFDWDEEEVSDDEEMTHVKVLMALADDELAVGKNHARNGEWIDITMRKVNILLSMDEDSDWQTYLKYINIDMKFVEEQRLNLSVWMLIVKDVEVIGLEGSESLTPLPPLKNLQGASSSSKVMLLTYQDHSPRRKPGLGTMKHTKPKTQESSSKSVLGPVTVCDTKLVTSLVPTEVKIND
ncbi:hypothetical protein Tco_0591827 [Tanacetum coccineum]